MTKKKKSLSKRQASSTLMAVAFAIMSCLGIAHFYDNLKPLLRKGAEYVIDRMTSTPAFPGDVISISDGDTLTVVHENGAEIKVRLYGIDAPESSQLYGTNAGQALHSLVNGRKITVTIIDVDRYGRSVSIVEADGININELMLEGGHAWYYGNYCRKNFCSRWEIIAEKARIEKKGLWENSKAKPPWEYRTVNKPEAFLKS